MDKYRVWVRNGLGIGLGLTLGVILRIRIKVRVRVRVRVGLSGRNGNYDRETLGSGNSDQKPRNYQHLWVLIPKVGNSDDL